VQRRFAVLIPLVENRFPSLVSKRLEEVVHHGPVAARARDVERRRPELITPAPAKTHDTHVLVGAPKLHARLKRSDGRGGDGTERGERQHASTFATCPPPPDPALTVSSATGARIGPTWLPTCSRWP
jgi:hypothetical protein